MRNNAEAVSFVHYGEVRGPYVENVECSYCKELNPKGQDKCNGCGHFLVANA